MLAFKPKAEPFLTKLFKSGLFQFMMVVLLGVGVTYFVVRTDQPQKWIQRINRFSSVTPNLQTSTTPTEAGIAEDRADLEAPPPAANSWAARSASVPVLTASAMTAETSAGTAESLAFTGGASATLNSTVSAKLRIQMVEIDHDYLNTLMNGKGTALTGDIISFRSFLDLVIDSSNIKVLKTDSLEFSIEKKDLAISAGNGARWVRLTMSALDIRYAIKYFDAFFIKNHPNDTQKIPVDLTLRPGEKFILSGSGLLSYYELEPELANIAPFQIFKSADYRNQKTTFAIIFELQ